MDASKCRMDEAPARLSIEMFKMIDVSALLDPSYTTFFPLGFSRYTQIISTRCSTFLNSGSPVTMIALCSIAEARIKQSA